METATGIKVGALVTITWPELDIVEPAIVVLGDTEDEVIVNANGVFSQYENGNPLFVDIDMDEVQVIELHRDEWFVAKIGQNIGRGWLIIDTANIKYIYN